MEKMIDIFPTDLTKFVLVAVFSLLIGLSQRKQFLKREEKPDFGSDRTFTLIGLLGLILYIVEPKTYIPFLCGGLALLLFLCINYVHKLFTNKGGGITRYMTSLITYCLGPLVYTQELWICIIVVVTILMLTESKEQFIRFTERINDYEFLNCAKFLILCGVILPILPDKEIIDGISLTPYNIWLATVVISGISYVSYLAKKYVFKDGGIIITGILGGLYSSTATTIILAKKAKEAEGQENEYASAIFCAISMLYLRVFTLLLIFNATLALQYWHIFTIMIALTSTIAFLFYRKGSKKTTICDAGEIEDKNPLEFKVAILFALLFVGLTLATHFTLHYFGDRGLKWLSILVGITDINPFIINLFQSTKIGSAAIIVSAMQAIVSNNAVQMLYGIFFSGKKLIRNLLIGFATICVTNIILIYLMI